MWVFQRVLYSRASCFDAYTFAKCSATSDQWYVHQLKLLVRASLVLCLQAPKQTCVQLGMDDCNSNHLKTALLWNCCKRTRCARTTLDAQTGPFAHSGRDVPVEELPNDEKHQCANLRFQNVPLPQAVLDLALLCLILCLLHIRAYGPYFVDI